MNQIAWRDPMTPWQVKLGRAAEHLRDLRSQVGEYASGKPHEVVHEPTDVEHLTRVRVVLRREPPAVIGAIIGDVLHNLRSALDSVAYAVIVAEHEDQWNTADDWRPQFPITKNGAEFDEFMNTRRHQIVGERARAALRFGQEFYFREQFNVADIDVDVEWTHDQLRQLRDLSNLDKHRRLTFTAWQQADLVYWGSAGPGPSTRRLRPRQADDPPDVIGYEYNPPGGPDDGPTVREFSLAITEVGISRSERVVDRLDSWHAHVGSVIGRVANAWDHPSAERVVNN
ncbi:MAG: hypothetical protein ACRCYU_19605 [Nocardioides sp.]